MRCLYHNYRASSGQSRYYYNITYLIKPVNLLRYVTMVMLNTFLKLLLVSLYLQSNNAETKRYRSEIQRQGTR